MATNKYRYKKANEIVSTLIDNTLTNTDKVNDFTDGSVIKTLYQAVSTEIEQFYYLNIENIKFGVWDSIFQAFEFGRKPELKAYGQVLLTYATPITRPYTIAKGTKFTSSDSLYPQTYETLDEYTIPQGVQYALVTVYCTEGGTVGNIPSQVIDTVSHLGTVAGVTNTEAFATGQDEETIEQVRVRFRAYIQALQRGTVQALQYGASTVPNIAGAYVDESPGYVRLYAHDANGDLSNTLKQEVQQEMLYWRSAGIPVEVLPVHKTYVDANIGLQVNNSNLKVNEFLEAVRVKLIKYINQKQVHDPLVLADVIQQIMDASDLGITDSITDLMVYPDSALRNGLAVSANSSIYLNEHLINKALLTPKDRTESEDYIVSNPEDLDANQYAYIKDDDIKNGDGYDDDDDLTTTNPDYQSQGRTSSTTYAPLQMAITDANGNTTKATTSGILNSTDPNDTLGQGNYVNPKPFTINDTGIQHEFTYLAEDGSQFGLVVDTSNNINEFKVLDTTGAYSEYDVEYTDSSKIIYIYGADGTRPASPDDTNEKTLNDNFKGDVFGKYMGVTASMITLRETAGADSKGAQTRLYRNKNASGMYVITRESTPDKTSLVLSYNPDQQNFSVVSYASGITTTRNYDSTGTFTDAIVQTTSTVGNSTTIYTDANGSTTRTIITDKYGNVLSDSANNDNVTESTTSVTDETTQYVEPDIEATTTTTTKYPFTVPPTVSASDAPDEGYLPVFKQYNTSVNEILKAGVISIYFVDNN